VTASAPPKAAPIVAHMAAISSSAWKVVPRALVGRELVEDVRGRGDRVGAQRAAGRSAAAAATRPIARAELPWSCGGPRRQGAGSTRSAPGKGRDVTEFQPAFRTLMLASAAPASGEGLFKYLDGRLQGTAEQPVDHPQGEKSCSAPALVVEPVATSARRFMVPICALNTRYLSRLWPPGGSPRSRPWSGSAG